MLLLGVDIGTTNLKVLAIDTQADQVLGHATRPVATLSPKPGWAEQDPKAIWHLFEDAVHECRKELGPQADAIAGVCFSTAMHSLLAVDDAGKPLTNALLWSDNRASREAAMIGGRLEVVKALNVPVHPMLPLCKLAWFSAHNPRLLKRAVRWLSLKEYIWWHLTGRYEIDYAMAGATGLFDNGKRTWYGPALALADVRADQLSTPVNTTHTVAYQPPERHKALFTAGTPLIIGASDGCLANLGAGAVEPGVTTITIGTSGAVRRTSNRPVHDDRLFSYLLYATERTRKAGAEPDRYVVGGPTNNGANVLEWLSEKLTHQDAEAVLKEAATVPPGSDGLLFRPYLQGERAPLWDATVRGSYHHVDWMHTQAHFARAALEGVLFNLRRTELLLARHAGPTRVIYANGGFAQSAFWVQMMADIFNVPVRLNASNESGAIGAVRLAQFALAGAAGKPVSLTKLAADTDFGHTFTPHADTAAIYRKQYKQFEGLSG